MRKDSVLEDYVVPLCSAEVSGGEVRLKRLFGTAFFINDSGVFLSAKHVLEAISEKQASGIHYGLVVKSKDSPPISLFASLRHWEYAPKPFDVAIGKVEFGSISWFSTAQRSFENSWKDVATIGYPETALNTSATQFNIHLRAHKGYIQRFVSANEIDMISPHPDCYELSFPITSGMSGAPLFTADGDQQNLVGICVGSYSAEITEYQSERVIEKDGGRFEERRVKVEQIGVSESILPLLDWTPGLLGGVTRLGQAIAPSSL